MFRPIDKIVASLVITSNCLDQHKNVLLAFKISLLTAVFLSRSSLQPQVHLAVLPQLSRNVA